MPLTGVVSSPQRRGAVKKAASIEYLFLPPKNMYLHIYVIFIYYEQHHKKKAFDGDNQYSSSLGAP